jgi:hypothetical protein
MDRAGSKWRILSTILWVKRGNQSLDEKGKIIEIDQLHLSLRQKKNLGDLRVLHKSQSQDR